MRFVIEREAEPGTRFAQSAFASQVGRAVTVAVAEGEYEQGMIRGAEVIEDGRKVRIDVEVPDCEDLRILLSPWPGEPAIAVRPPWVL